MDTKEKNVSRICWVKETHFSFKDTNSLKVKEWQKISHGNGNQNIAGVATLALDKIDLQSKLVTRDKEGHYILIKVSIKQFDTTAVIWRTLR